MFVLLSINSSSFKRFYRIVHSIELFDASHSAKEFLNVFRRRDFEAIFQKSFRVFDFCFYILFNLAIIDSTATKLIE